MSAKTSPSALSKEDEDDLAAINSAIDRMRAFTPADPYILTIPQDVEPRYHHMYKYQATQWLDHTPFEPREHESTQYQTFIYREPGRDMYQLHNSRPGEAAGTNGHKAGGGGVATGASTPSGAPKKKISLSAYKMKQNNAATPDRKEAEQSQSQAKQPAVKGPIERLKADEEIVAAVESGDDLVPASPTKEDKKDLKRKRDDVSAKEEVELNGDKKIEHAVEDEFQSKKARRTSPSPEPKRETGHAENSQTDQEQSLPDIVKHESPTPKPSRESILPPRLSPPPVEQVKSQLPPKLSPVRASTLLPPRLSPTLPTNIAASLKARAHNRSVSRSSDLPGSRSGSKGPDTRHLTPPPKSIPRNGFRANSGSPAVRSDVEDRGRRETPLARAVPTPDPDSEASEEIVVSKGGVKKPKKQLQRESSSEKESLVVTLKYQKSNGKEVREILAKSPKPTKSSTSDTEEADTVEVKDVRKPSKASDARQRGQRDTNAKGVAQKVGPTSATNGVKKKDEGKNGVAMERKRSRSDDSDFDDSPSKRKKTTPDSSSFKSRDPSSPGLQRPSSQPVANTMRKDVLSAAMKREHSNDSTFGSSHALSQTSPSVQGSHTSQPPNGTPSTTTRTSTPLEKAWRAEEQRLEGIGKDLKQSATEHATTASNLPKGSTPKLPAQKLAAITSLEAFLAFLLAFICDDQSQYAADPRQPARLKPWRSLQGFYGWVKRHCEPFPPLHGLACALVMVCTGRTLELATQQRPEAGAEPSLYPLPQDQVLDIAAQIRRAAVDADAKLDADVLEASFPRAWAGRAKGVVEREILEVGKGFAGRYKLPFGVQMSPLIAARAAFAVLEEWVQREGEGYVLKLKL